MSRFRSNEHFLAVDLHLAIRETGPLGKRQVDLLKLCYPFGYTITKAAALLGISDSTARCDRALGHDWLQGRVAGTGTVSNTAAPLIGSFMTARSASFGLSSGNAVARGRRSILPASSRKLRGSARCDDPRLATYTCADRFQRVSPTEVVTATQGNPR